MDQLCAYFLTQLGHILGTILMTKRISCLSCKIVLLLSHSDSQEKTMADKNVIKTKLRIALYAGNELVAESHDKALWHKVFSTLADEDEDSRQDKPESFLKSSEPASTQTFYGGSITNSSDAVSKFARDLGITKEEVIGACAPSLEQPYLELDMKYWESFFNTIPAKGPASVSKIGLAATLLCLWFRSAKIEGNPTAADCQQVLETVKTREANPTRSIDNSSWLQRRGKGIVINPARTSKALEIAKMYCLEGRI